MISQNQEFKIQRLVALESLQERLIKNKILSQGQVQVLLEEKRNTQKPFLQLAIDFGFVEAHHLKSFLVETYQLMPFSLQGMRVTPSLLEIFPQQVAEQHKVFPFYQDTRGLHVAMADINNIYAYDMVREYFNASPLILYIATVEEILQGIKQYYGQQNSLETLLLQFDEKATKALISHEDPLPIRFIDTVIAEAIHTQSSDIHFEPKNSHLSLRFRCNGILQEKCVVHKQYWPALLARLKIMTGMNITESRLPQVGRYSYLTAGRTIDLRASSHPTCHGESFVLRVLDKFHGLLALEDLGFFPSQVSLLKQTLKRPEGLVILTGPTGSGKTTTLYSMLSYLSSKELNIMTLEDPIEYELQNVRQTQVDDFIGFTFAEGVRSILRQDPDVVLIGEIRDDETARMALRASMTGHLVLTTLHTNEALGAVRRLIDLGVPASLLSGTIKCIVAQRLVRRLCQHCKNPISCPSELKPLFSLDPAKDFTLYDAKGCSLCYHSGYQGRIAVAEIIPITQVLDELLINQHPHRTLLETARGEGFKEMAYIGKKLIIDGITSFKEVERVIYLN
jgi:type IV pilus assembly protein PilB